MTKYPFTVHHIATISEMVELYEMFNTIKRVSELYSDNLSDKDKFMLSFRGFDHMYELDYVQVLRHYQEIQHSSRFKDWYDYADVNVNNVHALYDYRSMLQVFKQLKGEKLITNTSMLIDEKLFTLSDLLRLRNHKSTLIK